MRTLQMLNRSAGLFGFALAFSALAAEPPVLKSGLWEVTRSGGQQPERKSLTTMCLDESVQAQMREFGMGAAKELCSQSDRSFEGNKMTMTATCKLGQTTMKTSSVMTFFGNASYHMDGTRDLRPADGNDEGHEDNGGRQVGRCVQARATAGRRHARDGPDSQYQADDERQETIDGNTRRQAAFGSAITRADQEAQTAAPEMKGDCYGS